MSPSSSTSSSDLALRLGARSRTIAVAFAIAALATFFAGLINLELRGLARHSEDIKVFALARMRGNYDRLILSDSVTAEATRDVVLDPRDYPLMTNGYLRLAGQFFLLRRALERGTFKEVDLFLTPDLLLANVDNEQNGRIRYTYIDSLFRRADEIADLRAAGDLGAGQRWVLFDLLLKSFQTKPRSLPAQTVYQAAEARPDEEEAPTAESRERLQWRAAYFAQFAVTTQNAYFLRRIAQTCAAAKLACRLVVEPLPASLPRLDLKSTLGALAPGVAIVDINDFARFPNAAFSDGLHLKSAQWRAYYRTLLAEHGLMHFPPPEASLSPWRGERLALGSDASSAFVHFASAVYPAEGWGRWSGGPRSAFYVKLDTTVKRPARVALELTALVRNKAQRIVVAIDGASVCEREVTVNGPLEMICDIPDTDRDATKIEINMSFANSPKERGGADDRLLQIGLCSLELR